MLVSLSEQLQEAKKGKYAVGLFNVVSLEMMKGVFRAAEVSNSPLIIGCAEVMTKHISLEELSALALPMIKRTDIPVTLHFDHAHTPTLILRAMRLGFNSIMYDCSDLPFEENCERVREMTQAAHDKGVCLEAELGSVAGVEGDDAVADIADSVYTSPELAGKFIEYTGADALAVAIGNAHGAYKGKPQLRFDILQRITQNTDVPLVLHGGSGIPEDDFKHVISMGITKVNIFTDINKAAARAAHDAYCDGCGYTKISPAIEQAVYETALERMEFFKNR